jgi:hypothetical protein
MVIKFGAVLEKPVEKTTCRHHWVIEPPDGPTSRGKCKLCGELKIFDNMLEESAPVKYLDLALVIGDVVDEVASTDTKDK